MKFYLKSFILGEIIVLLVSILLIGLEVSGNNAKKEMYTEYLNSNLICTSRFVPFECGWTPEGFLVTSIILFTFLNCIVQIAIYVSRERKNIVIPNYIAILIVISLTILGFFFLSIGFRSN